MNDVATYVRIFNPDPSDDLVAKRVSAIKDLTSRYNKLRPVTSILQTANDLAAAIETKGKLSELATKEIEGAIRNAGADAFVADGQDLQMLVCGLAGALQALDKASPTRGEITTPTVLAIGLWSALSYQASRSDKKIESLRVDVMSSAQRLVLESATTSRERIKVPDFTFTNAEPFDAETLTKSIHAGSRSTINALRTNAAIDREEIDLLWWTLGDWSSLLSQNYSSPPNPLSTAISSGLEVGAMLRRLPSNAHKNLVLRQVASDAAYSLAELIAGIGDDRTSLAASIEDSTLTTACPNVFPLLTSLQTGSAQHSRAKTKRSVSEWAVRALIESSTLRVISLLPALTV